MSTHSPLPHVIFAEGDRFTACGIYLPNFPKTHVETLMGASGDVCPRCCAVIERKVSSVLDRIDAMLKEEA